MTTSRTKVGRWFTLMFAFVWFAGAATTELFAQTATADSVEHASSWSRDYTLILLDTDSVQRALDAVEEIEAAGGRVGVVASRNVLLGWVPSEVGLDLVGRRGIRSIHHAPVASADVDLDEDGLAAVQFFNEVVSGEWDRKKGPVGSESRTDTARGADGLIAPPISREDVQRNLESVGFSPDQAAAALSPGLSEAMVGRINFNAIFVESSGAIDSNVYSWSTADVDTIKSEITASLSFWSSRAPTYGVPLTFVTTFYTPHATPGRVRTSYEPILHPSSDDGLWIGQIMCNFGHCTGDKWARTEAFNAARRVRTRTNWATTSFIGYNPSPAPGSFVGGGSAYAYLKGPYSQLLFRNGGWLVSQYDQVNAHETGHLFGARDQYPGSGCTCFTPGNHGVYNGNCVSCNASSVPSIMRYNEPALDGYAPGQIGWAVLVDSVRASRTDGTARTKASWVPGQTARYRIQFQLPGRPDSLGMNSHTATTRWYLQFPGGVTQTFGPLTNTLTSGNTWDLSIDQVIPDVPLGEATLEVFLEVSNYGKGGRASAKRSLYVLGAGANPTVLRPTASPEEIDESGDVEPEAGAARAELVPSTPSKR